MTEGVAYNDLELWAQIKNNDYNAFNVLLDRYWQILLNTAYKRVQSLDISQDIVQDVFLNIWLKRATLDIENPEAYFKTAVRYRVYTHFSRNKISQEFIELFDEISDPTVKAENNLRFSDLKKLVRAWIDTLPAKQRQIFILYLEEHLSTKEIAQQLNISQKTVQNQLNRSMGGLRAKLSGNYTVIILFV